MVSKVFSFPYDVRSDSLILGTNLAGNYKTNSWLIGDLPSVFAKQMIDRAAITSANPRFSTKVRESEYIR